MTKGKRKKKKTEKKVKNTHLSVFRRKAADEVGAGVSGGGIQKRYRILEERMRKLEQLVEIISRGKYQWEATFDAITSPVMIVSKDYHVERANVSMAHISGEDITKVTGRQCYEVFAGRREPCEGCPLRHAIASDSPAAQILSNKIRKKDFEAHAYPYVLEGRGTNAAVMYYRDVTEERRLQQEAIQQEKMAAIGLLAGGIAHEINNPLGGILAFTQLLMRDAKDNDALLRDLKEIECAAVRCKKIVSDLLDYSRVSKEKEKCLLDVNSLLEKVLPFISGDIKSLNIELVFDKAKKIPQILGNPDRIQQIFLNLLTNACHAMPKGGVLTLKTAADDNKGVVVSVSDTGIGISRDDLNKIFEPFYTTKEASKGTGLGLSIAYRIVKEHNGTIDVESELGQGTKFTVCFPAA
jgi:two-component system NtrC family sensor kinase